MLHFLMIIGSLHAQPTLPNSVADALVQAQVPSQAFSGYLARVDQSQPTWAWQADTIRQPASLMKLLTTYLGLRHLGSQYRWETPIYTLGVRDKTRWNGQVYLVGQGDPTLTRERLWAWLWAWRQQGIREWGGEVIIDRQWLDEPSMDPNAFDGAGTRPYNVVADALPLQFNALRFTFQPNTRGEVDVLSDPPANPHLSITSHLQANTKPCNRDWDDALYLDRQAEQLHLRGEYPLACGKRDWYVSPFSHRHWANHYLPAVWESLGGVWQATIRDGTRPTTLGSPSEILRSPPLAEIVRDMNKFSNNLIARQLFLSLAPPPTRTEKATQVAHTWLQQHGLHFPELVLENGAGLSRREQITPSHLAQLLQQAWYSPVMPEFVASLPIAGQDGTLKQRLPTTNGSLRLKTGVLANVRGLAGYLQDTQGHWWVVVGLINHPQAHAARPALDAFMQWALQTANQKALESVP